MRWRLTIIAGAVVTVSLAHYLTPVGGHDDNAYHPQHALYRWFYHLPIIVAAFWFGLRGGVFTALAVTVLYFPHVLIQWSGGTPEQWLELTLYNIVGCVTGLLSQRQRDDRDRYRQTAEELDVAYDELKTKTGILLETEQQLRHADRLSALGRLSAGMAHEIKTPLASIRGAAEILTDPTTEEEEKEEFSRILVREADRLDRVVTQFLEFARPRDNGAPEADLEEAVGEVLQLVRMELRHQRISPERELDPDLPLVLVDAAQLRQVLLNLVMNAVQAMKDGGTLQVAATREAAGVRLIVADSGPGIPSKIRDRIFEPFVTGRVKGTGLGLSIVKRIVENHGGDIEIHSSPGIGTRIEVLLPMEVPTHEPDEENPARR
jgi:signal transduction histidine kinase